MSELFNDRVTVYLAIESAELLPSALTQLLSAQPDKQWFIGENRGRTGKKWDRNGWVVEISVNSEEYGGLPATDLIPIAITAFQTKVEPFASAASSLGASADRYAVLAIRSEEVPGIELTHEFLQLLTDLGGNFQVDISAEVKSRPAS